jgi:hypothetical protein
MRRNPGIILAGLLEKIASNHAGFGGMKFSMGRLGSP